MQAGEALTIRNPNAAKPWQYVLDILAGYLCLGQKLWEQPQAFSQAWNFRPQDEPMLTVGDMVQVLRDAYDPDYLVIIPFHACRPGTIAANCQRRCQ